MTMKAFIYSEFGYCPFVWMFHSRKLNSRVNKLHERALRIVYQDYASSFTYILEKDNSTNTHNRNIQLLFTELFNVKNGLSPPFTNKIFVENAQHYDLRNSEIQSSEIQIENKPMEPRKLSMQVMFYILRLLIFYSAYFIIFMSYFYCF